MLAQLEKPTNDFHALARYLIDGRENLPNPKRVAWIMAHNLGTDDPQLAAKLMTATAELSKRCKSACYHAMIAWHEEEQPSPEIMQEIARKTLHLAGLGEHQALIVGHGDKAHPHLHMMINRVHPDAGRAWSTSHDYRKFDRIMQQLSEEYGFRYVPPHSFHPELTDHLPKQPDSPAMYAAKRGALTNRPQWPKAQARVYGRQISEKLDAAAGWDDVEYAVAEAGFAIEPKGEGFVIGNSKGYTKLSALGLSSDAKEVIKRRTVAITQALSTPERSGRNWWDVDEVDIAKAVGGRDEYKRALVKAQAQRKAWLASAALSVQLAEELKEALTQTQKQLTQRQQPSR